MFKVYHQKPHAINIIRSWYRELRGWEEALAPVNETRDLVPGCSNISTVPRGQASLQRPSVNGFIALWLIGGKYQNLTMLVSGRNSEVNFQKVHEFFIDRRFQTCLIKIPVPRRFWSTSSFGYKVINKGCHVHFASNGLSSVSWNFSISSIH